MKCQQCGASCKWSENTNSKGKYFLIDLNTEAPHICPKKIYVKTFKQEREEYKPYTSEQLLHFKLISGPNGSMGKMELEKLKEMCTPSKVMMDAYLEEMSKKVVYDREPLRNKPKPKPQPRLDI